MRIVSGGQTGVDRAALDVAMELGLPCGGFCPRGRKAEDGVIDKKYPLIETPSDQYEQRTEWNVRDADATLILTWGTPRGGTELTIELAEKLKKPLCIVDIENKLPVEKIVEWIKKNNIEVLNVAGPRASFNTKVYPKAKKFLTNIFQGLI